LGWAGFLLTKTSRTTANRLWGKHIWNSTQTQMSDPWNGWHQNPLCMACSPLSLIFGLLVLLIPCQIEFWFQEYFASKFFQGIIWHLPKFHVSTKKTPFSKNDNSTICTKIYVRIFALQGQRLHSIRYTRISFKNCQVLFSTTSLHLLKFVLN
jgi:hypothetical protein